MMAVSSASGGRCGAHPGRARCGQNPKAPGGQGAAHVATYSSAADLIGSAPGASRKARTTSAVVNPLRSARVACRPTTVDGKHPSGCCRAASAASDVSMVAVPPC